MANNPFPIDIDETDYFNKQAREQRWILYCGMRSIHTHGCQWARGRWKRLVVYALILGTIAGLIGGFLGETGVIAKIF